MRLRLAFAVLAAAQCAAVALAGGSPASAARGPRTGPPETRITFGPAGLTNLTRPVFGYEYQPLEASVECRIDSEPFHSCPPVEYETYEEEPRRELSDGRHTFEVRAVNEQGEADPTPAKASLTVDTRYPVAEILSGPSGLTHQQRPKWRLRVAEADGFWCTIKGDDVRLKIKVRGCDGRHSFRSPRPLPEGHYTFGVLGYTRAGNVTENTAFFQVRTKPGAPPNPYRGSTLFKGGGNGIRVAIRVKERKLIRARVTAVLNCLKVRHGKRSYHRRAYRWNYATIRWPVGIDRGGAFETEDLAGHAGPRQISGTLKVQTATGPAESYSENHQVCQTGSFPRKPPRKLRFHARIAAVPR